MEQNRLLSAAMVEAFARKGFLQKLSMDRADAAQRFAGRDWDAILSPLLPMESRILCADALECFRPLMDSIAPEPQEGWLKYTYQVVLSLLFPAADLHHTPAQRDAALCFLQFLQVLYDAERKAVPFDPMLDFQFCTEEEMAGSSVAEEYRSFLHHFREEYIYELLRLGREVTPFRTLDHIAGVHHVAMRVARTFHAGGGLIDLPLNSGAAAGHDIGKFGCKPGERVPYLHYYYSDQWFTQRSLTNIGHIAANHSVWDLEIENLSSESLMLVYADFRVKQFRDENGQEVACIYSLKDAFDVILNKLDNVDEAKRTRYQFVYSKLLDFEKYLVTFGVDTSLETAGSAPLPAADPSLMTPSEVVRALRRTAVDHNIRLMHRLTHEQLFANILEAARSEKNWSKVRAYVSIFEEYFTYLSTSQKEQTLEFLYELLMYPDGDIRRQAASLIGRILAGFLTGYKKEKPAGAAEDPIEERPFQLWENYLSRLIHPDHRLTPRQTSMIRYQAKMVVDTLLAGCAVDDTPRFTATLMRHYQRPAQADPEAVFALLDTVLSLPLSRVTAEDVTVLTRFTIHWLAHGDLAQKAAALRLLLHLLEEIAQDDPLRTDIADAVQRLDLEDSALLLFLQIHLQRALGLPTPQSKTMVEDTETVSSIFLDNLKTATPWVLKAVGVEYLLDLVLEHNNHTNVLHIATHFSNLIKVSENVVVRRMAGASLLAIAPILTPDRRNEIAVELSKALETGQSEISRYIPEYLGQFALWLTPRELDEVIDQMQSLLSSANVNVVAASLSTVGAMLEHYAVYGERFGEDDTRLQTRRRRLAGLLLKGLASFREPVRQESLRILGEGLFASKVLSYWDKESLFTLLVKKLLVLINEGGERELTFFYAAAALSHIYRFIVRHRIEDGPFQFAPPRKAAFFPGTFDPFSLSHKGIVTAIRDHGFEVYLAIDEFSWSKKAQPSLVRRQIVNMSVADEFDVYLFPHDIPVNLATPSDLNRLRKVFSGRELYLAVGSDVVANASSYRIPPAEGSVHSLNHIVFRRTSDAEGREISSDLSCITGDVVELQLPMHLEDISSTRIRENIDMGRDISNLIDPAVQDYIYRNSLYLREPQYKQLIRTSYLNYEYVPAPSASLLEELAEAVSAGSTQPEFDPRDSVTVLREAGPHPRILGFLTERIINTGGLYEALDSAVLADYVRNRTAGRIQLLTSLHITHTSGNTYDVAQLLLTEVLSRGMRDDCGYAVWYATAGKTRSATLDMLRRQGFADVAVESPKPLMLVDMRSPVVLLQNIPTTLKEPFSSSPRVQEAVNRAHFRIQEALTAMYPGILVLSLNAAVIYHRLVGKIVELNGVPAEPTVPRVLGPKMCVPFGKILRGNAVPNTVTKTVHTDKVYAPDLRSFTIEAYPGYAPLESQIRTIKSFRRPVMLVDDLLHSGNRINALAPMFQRENIYIDKVLVGLLSGRGQDLMRAKHMDVDSVYFVPNMRAWYIESTMYPFIGGDTVSGTEASVPGLTPAVNLIMPYAFPNFYKECGNEAVFQFSRTCLENARDILQTLEADYRERYARNLTLSRLSEAVILPLSPDKGNCLHYDANLSASDCITHDLKMLLRMWKLLN